MEIINQSVSVLQRTSQIELIEAAGRTCYKSESQITEDSSKKFVATLLKRGHFSVIEHGAMGFFLPEDLYITIADSATNFGVDVPFHSFFTDGRRFSVSANLRAWWEYFADGRPQQDREVAKLLIRLANHFPILFADHLGDPEPVLAQYVDILPFGNIEHISFATDEEHWHHRYVTVRFITNRGVSHELVRHRRNAISQESTRYVNYGGHDIQFIKPVWWDESALQIALGESLDNRHFSDSEMASPEYSLLYGLSRAEDAYDFLLQKGWRPEQAREVLPNALKTEVVMTANLEQWHHIFTLRCSKAAHPQIRDLMNQLLHVEPFKSDPTFDEFRN